MVRRPASSHRVAKRPAADLSITSSELYPLEKPPENLRDAVCKATMEQCQCRVAFQAYAGAWLHVRWHCVSGPLNSGCCLRGAARFQPDGFLTVAASSERGRPALHVFHAPGCSVRRHDECVGQRIYGARPGSLSEKHKQTIIEYLQVHRAYRIQLLMEHLLQELGEDDVPEEQHVKKFVANWRQRNEAGIPDARSKTPKCFFDVMESS